MGPLGSQNKCNLLWCCCDGTMLWPAQLEERVEIYRLHAGGNLKTKLRLRLNGRHRQSVGSCGATRSPPRSGRVATSLSGLSDWPSAGGDGNGRFKLARQPDLRNRVGKALRWDIPQSRSLADWRWSMVASSSA